jgi:branched-chain amino acid transport system ATP-binding protein
MQVCSKIYVLDFGQMMASGTPAEVRADAKVQAAYLGTAKEVAA